MVPLCDPSFFALSDEAPGALRPERGLASARRTRFPHRDGLGGFALPRGPWWQSQHEPLFAYG